MKINLNTFGICFQKALPTSLKKDYKKTVHQAKEALGIQDGVSILKIHSGSMPKQDVFDTGIGKLNSKPALDFIEKMTFYTDTNAIKEFPKGQITKHFDKFYCPYLKTATTFGEENINLLNLVQDKATYGDILSLDDIEGLNINSDSERIIYENELGTDENYPTLKPLRRAFENFKDGKNIPEKLKLEFEEYKKQPLVEDTYARLALYPYIHEKEPNLFHNFEYSFQKQNKFEKYKHKYKDEIEFFQFRQFIAKKEHDSAKEKINSKGVDLFGDCLIGFSNQEVWAHPDAFAKDTCIGLYEWGLPALNFKNILNPDSEAYKVFNDKISFFLNNYDGIRFDVGWCYAVARLGKKGKSPVDYDMGHKIFDFINQRAREIKGDNFDTRKLIYEMDGFLYLYKWGDSNTPPVISPNVKGIVNVLTTQWQHDNGFGWGSPKFHLSHGLTQDELIMGTNNHDGSNLLQLAERDYDDKDRKTNVDVLSKLFHIKPKDFKDVKTFVKAKFAQLFTTKNQFLFQNDVMGTDDDMDDQTISTDNYRTRFSKDFEKEYHLNLQDGTAFNLPESLKMAMEAKGLDKTNAEIYSKISYYCNYLKEKGALSEEEANSELNR